MASFKAGQVVELRSGVTARIERSETHERGSMANVEYYWVTRADNNLPLQVKGIDILRVLQNASPSQKIKVVAKKVRTTGIWYSWGPAKFNQLWVAACQQQRILEHALSISKANSNLAGPGLYMATELWRSSVYAQTGANLLIIQLRDVPTIDIRQGNQITELQQPPPPVLQINDLSTEKINPENVGILARYLLIYTTHGHFACLTAHKGVTCSLDLGDIPALTLLSQAAKLGEVAAQPLWDQAVASPRLSAHTRTRLKTILTNKGAKTG